MSQLIAMFCDIDDFCKVFEPFYTQRLLQNGQRQRVRQRASKSWGSSLWSAVISSTGSRKPESVEILDICPSRDHS